MRTLASPPLATVVSYPWDDQDERAQERKANAKAAEERLQQRQAELAKAYEDLDANKALFLLYARAPLHEANDRLQVAFEQVLDDDEVADSISEVSAEWAKTAQRELVAIGSIGWAVVAYGARSLRARRRMVRRRHDPEVITEGMAEASQAVDATTSSDAGDDQPRTTET